MKIIVKNGYNIFISEKSVDPKNDKKIQDFWDLYQRDWEMATFKIFERYLKKDKGFIDIGAWIGPTVLYGSQIAKKCYCFEPDKTAYEYLQNNIDENKDIKDKIKCFDFGIANKNSKETFYVGSGATSISSLLPIWNKSESYTIEVHDFAAAIEISGMDFKEINFIKIDIEGAEYELIPSLVEYIKKTNNFPTLYISLHAPFTYRKFWKNNIFLRILAFFPKKISARLKNRNLIKVLSSCYKNIYRSNGKKLRNLSELGDASFFTEVVATNLSHDQ